MTAEKVRDASPHDRRALYELLLVLAVFLALLSYSIITRTDLGLIGYAVVIGWALYGPIRRHRPWRELGLKRGFLRDLRKNWYLFAIEAFVLQMSLPVLARGFWPDLWQHIIGRLPVLSGSPDLTGAVGLLIVALPLTLFEEVIYRVVFQERLSWFIGTPAAVILSSIMFGMAHLSSGPPLVVIADVGGVILDGLFYGTIYARTHNLALSWATHYIADLVGLIFLLAIF